MFQFNPIHFVANLEPALPCLYGLIDKFCTYDPRSAPIHFSLGEAVAALGLIFAALQLSNEKKKITLIIKEWYLRHMVWILSGIGLVAIFIASFVPQIPYLNSPFNYPIFWEQIGFVFFISGPISYLIIAGKSHNIYNAKRAERFYHVVLQKASNGKQEDLEAVITIIWDNLEKLTAVIKTINRQLSREITEDDKEAIQAKSLLNLLLSEKIVADYIVTYRIGFLFALIHNVKKNNLLQRTIGMGFQKIVKRLFENPDSYLYKQLDYEGVSIYAPIYDTLFGDSYFVTEFSVLRMWDEYGVSEEIRTTEKYIQVFLKALNTAIETNKFQNDSVSQGIANSLSGLDDYVRHLTWLSKTTSKEVLGMIFMHIEGFFGRDFPIAYKNAVEHETVSNYEKEAKKGERYRQSLTATYAESVVDFLGHLANMDDRKLERDRAMTSSNDILSIHDDGGLFDNIRTSFLSFLWERIDDNVKRGHFPVVLRIYIQLMYWNDPSMPEWRKKERKKLIVYLNKELKPRIIKGELMANYKDTKETELLPDDIKFERKSKNFYLYHRDNTREEFS